MKDYTPHSWCVYLCNALAAQGLGDEQIQVALRWASVDALNTHRLTSAEAYTAWLRAAMGACFNVMRGAARRGAARRGATRRGAAGRFARGRSANLS